MALIVGLTATALLFVGGVLHIIHHRRFPQLLDQHGGWTRPLRVLPAIELALPVIVLTGVATGSAVTTGVGAGAIAALSLGFTGWVLRLVLTKSSLACACSASAAPASWPSVGRAAVGIAALALIAVGDVGAADLITATAVASAVALGVYALPDALAWPRFARLLATPPDTAPSVAPYEGLQ